MGIRYYDKAGQADARSWGGGIVHLPARRSAMKDRDLQSGSQHLLRERERERDRWAHIASPAKVTLPYTTTALNPDPMQIHLICLPVRRVVAGPLR